MARPFNDRQYNRDLITSPSVADKINYCPYGEYEAHSQGVQLEIIYKAEEDTHRLRYNSDYRPTRSIMDGMS